MTKVVKSPLPHGRIPFAQMKSAELRDFAMKANENMVALQKKVEDLQSAVLELQRR